MKDNERCVFEPRCFTTEVSLTLIAESTEECFINGPVFISTDPGRKMIVRVIVEFLPEKETLLNFAV